jgi:hypothetical protein
MEFETDFSCTKFRADQKLVKFGPHETNADSESGSLFDAGNEGSKKAAATDAKFGVYFHPDAQILRNFTDVTL